MNSRPRLGSPLIVLFLQPVLLFLTAGACAHAGDSGTPVQVTSLPTSTLDAGATDDREDLDRADRVEPEDREFQKPDFRVLTNSSDSTRPVRDVRSAKGADGTDKGKTAAAETPTPRSSPGSSRLTPGSPDYDPEACLDAALQEEGLNRYGHPEGLMYAGGTPLFDERTGERTPRREFVGRSRPDLLERCPERKSDAKDEKSR